jgi:hypothetical protein
MKKVSVAGKKIPVVINGGITEAYFRSGEHGTKERGRYRFWTACGEDQFGDWKIIGRARSRLSPGDRFSRMARESKNKKIPKADRAIYKLQHKLLGSTKEIRPSTAREVKRWVDTHTEPPHLDATFIRWPMVIKGKKTKHLKAVY